MIRSKEGAEAWKNSSVLNYFYIYPQIFHHYDEVSSAKENEMNSLFGETKFQKSQAF